jgi:hypothetical protein
MLKTWNTYLLQKQGKQLLNLHSGSLIPDMKSFCNATIENTSNDLILIPSVSIAKGMVQTRLRIILPMNALISSLTIHFATTNTY